MITAHIGSAWEYDEHTGEYYLHLYAKEQPDLNWEHEPVRKAVYDIMRFWLDKGCDGFRMDVINFISKDQRFPDAPVKDPERIWQWAYMFYANGPRLHEYLQDIGKILQEYDAFSVGEMPFVRDKDEVLRAVRHDRGELAMIFQFDHVDIDHGEFDKFAPTQWKLTDLKFMFETWQKFMYANDGWNALYWENHDQPRSIDRYTDAKPEFTVVASKMLATVLALMSGTPFIYQGQELGMRNVPKEWGIEEYKDIDCLNHWRGCVLVSNLFPNSRYLSEVLTEQCRRLANQGHDKKALQIALEQYQRKSRDNARTPMQWSSAPNAGFTSPNVKPWMSVNPNHVTVNAEAELADPDSTFNYWASVLDLRKEYLDIFVYGDFVMLDRYSEDIFAYTRQYEDQQALVLCNWTEKPLEWDPVANGVKGVRQVLLNNYESQGGVKEKISGKRWPMRPYEASVLLVEA